MSGFRSISLKVHDYVVCTGMYIVISDLFSGKIPIYLPGGTIIEAQYLLSLNNNSCSARKRKQVLSYFICGEKTRQGRFMLLILLMFARPHKNTIAETTSEY